MHRLHIAHGVRSFRESVKYSLLSTPHQDVFTPNIVAATEENARRDARLTAGRVYLIDFETCRQFEHGPGVQTAVPLPNTHVDPPLGMKSFDPFSWDVYCLGMTLEFMVQVRRLGGRGMCYCRLTGSSFVYRVCSLMHARRDYP